MLIVLTFSRCFSITNDHVPQCSPLDFTFATNETPDCPGTMLGYNAADNRRSDLSEIVKKKIMAFADTLQC